jgi:hypothetical protein
MSRITLTYTDGVLDSINALVGDDDAILVDASLEAFFLSESLLCLATLAA